MPSDTSPIHSERMPVVFIGHGSPMNAIEDNEWSRGFREVAQTLPTPRAILCISAHWFVPGTHVTGNAHPETIHDFGGFPQALFDMRYPARGDVTLAKRVVNLVGEDRASLREDWGLDHGTWSVLHYLRPQADVPVIQLSIDHRLAPAEHVALGQRLAPLRNEGVLILGSGNITHNLRHAFGNMRAGVTETPDWAARFDSDVESALTQHDDDALARMATGDLARMAHPTLDHYFPLLYAVGAADKGDSVAFPITGFAASSLSMRSVVFR